MVVVLAVVVVVLAIVVVVVVVVVMVVVTVVVVLIFESTVTIAQEFVASQLTVPDAAMIVKPPELRPMARPDWSIVPTLVLLLCQVIGV